MCGRNGFFLWVSTNGLCKSCEPIVMMDIQQRLRIISDCMDIITKSPNFKTCLSRCDILVKHAQVLLQYEFKGIQTVSPSPSRLLRKYTEMREQIVLKGITAEVEKALTKAEIVATPRTSINQGNKALLDIQEAKQELSDPTKLDQLESRVQRFLHKTRLDGYLEEARKAEFKGQRKKALDRYKEALYFLRGDNIDDSLQEEKISEIETKILELAN